MITGLRRTGKTSLMKVAYKQTRGKKVYIDGREAGKNVNEISKNILAEMSKNDFMAKIIGKIAMVEVSHFPVSIRLRLTKNEKRLADVLSQVDCIVIFIDEVQRLKPTGFDRFISYVYDNHPNVKFVLSGSEIGVLDEFLGRRREDTPLYGRAVEMIHLHPLSENKSIQFLKGGLSEVGRTISEKKLRNVTYQLDGIIGWLTMFGWFIYKGHSVDESIKSVLNEGGVLIRKEFESFLSNRSQARKRYTNILRFVSKESATWTEIKEYLERKEKKNINDKQVTKYINNLADYGFLLKKGRLYSILDPVMISLFR